MSGDEKVLHVSTSAQVGGVSEVVRAELDELRRRGINGQHLGLNQDRRVGSLSRLLIRALHSVEVPELPQADQVLSVLAGYGRAEAERLLAFAGDPRVIVLHDPLAGSLIPYVTRPGRFVLWRLHVGDDEHDYSYQRAESVLARLAERADLVAHVRREYRWNDVDEDKTAVIPPCIDPDSIKHEELNGEFLQNAAANLLTSGRAPSEEGSPDEKVIEDNGTGYLPSVHVPWYVQLARWDDLKGHAQLLKLFRTVAAADREAHLVMLGPWIDPVHSFPANSQLFQELMNLREHLEEHTRARLHLWMFRPVLWEVEARAVNVVERCAPVVVQNSLREAYGLTVLQALWKRRVVVGSSVGGIRHQLRHERNGLLGGGKSTGIDDPGLLHRALRDQAGRAEWSLAGRLSREEGTIVEEAVDRQLRLFKLF